MSELRPDLRIGQLLEEMGLLSSKDLDQSLRVTRETELPVGSVLLMSGCLQERELRAIVQAQSMLKDGLVTTDIVKDAMALVKERNLTLDAALKELRWVRDFDLKSNTLGELLTAARLVSSFKLAKALTIVKASMLPLGRVLVLMGDLSPDLLKTALDVQEAIRNHEISRDDGIQKLMSVGKRRVTIETTLAARDQRKRFKVPVRLGELLVEAGVISETELLNALEISLSNEKMIGEVLLEFNWVPDDLLRTSLDLQRLVSYGIVSRDLAVRALVEINETGATLGDALEHEILPNNGDSCRQVTRSEFMRLTGVVTGVDVQIADEEEPKDETGHRKMIRSLVFADREEKTIEEVAMTVHDYVKQGSLKLDQAVLVLDYCQRGRMPVKKAFEQLGWSIPIRISSMAPVR